MKAEQCYARSEAGLGAQGGGWQEGELAQTSDFQVVGDQERPPPRNAWEPHARAGLPV